MTLNRKIAYIDLSTGVIETAPIPVEMRKLYLGGRGLDMYLLYNHLKPGVDPLGPNNVLTISAGLLVGTLASASARTHIGAKSPLTGFVGSSNMGGFFAPELRWAGFDHLVVKGKAEGPSTGGLRQGLCITRALLCRGRPEESSSPNSSQT